MVVALLAVSCAKPGDGGEDGTRSGVDGFDASAGAGGSAGTTFDAGREASGGTGFSDMSPVLGQALPDGPAGEWQWIAVPGARCRDGL